MTWMPLLLTMVNILDVFQIPLRLFNFSYTPDSGRPSVKDNHLSRQLQNAQVKLHSSIILFADGVKPLFSIQESWHFDSSVDESAASSAFAFDTQVQS